MLLESNKINMIIENLSNKYITELDNDNVELCLPFSLKGSSAIAFGKFTCPKSNVISTQGNPLGTKSVILNENSYNLDFGKGRVVRDVPVNIVCENFTNANEYLIEKRQRDFVNNIINEASCDCEFH